MPVFILVDTIRFSEVKQWLTRHRSVLFVAGLSGLYILSVLWHLGYLNLRIEESRRAIVSLEMLQTGNFVQPKTLGWEYYNKPPFFNWILAGFIKLTGSDAEFVLRLPSFISLLLIGLIHYWVAKKFLPKTVAALSAFFTITCADIYFYTLSNGTEIDVFYSLIVYLQAISMFYFFEKKNYTSLFVVSWVLCAVGFLTKGLPSVLFQVLTLVALCIYGKSWKIFFKPQQVLGIMLFTVITGSYYYLYSRYSDPLVPLVTLFKESLIKSAVGEESKGRLYRVFTYPIVLLRVLSPWCLLLLVLFKQQRVVVWNNPLARFSALFILLNIAVYWITGAQKTRYIIMFIPFAMTIISYLYWQWEKQNPALIHRYLKFAGLFFCLVLITVLALPFISGIAWWKSLCFASLMLVFIYFYFRARQYRIWFFILGFIFTRLIYAAIGIPVKAGGETDYENLANGIAAKNNYQQIKYWGTPDTLDMNVKIGIDLFQWRDKPVKVLPYFIRYQVPYYLYQATGSLVRFDTTMEANKTYVSFRPYLGKIPTARMDYFYDQQFRDYLVVFRSNEIHE